MKNKATPSLNTLIYELCRYGASVNLFDPLDQSFVINRILALFKEDAYTAPTEDIAVRPLAEILEEVPSEQRKLRSFVEAPAGARFR